MAAVRFCLSLALVFALVSCSGSGHTPGVVGENGVSLKAPGGLTVKVPKGALPRGSRVTAQERAQAPVAQLGGLHGGGPVWDVHADRQPAAPVTLVMPYDPARLPSGARPLVVSYDPDTSWWNPVPTRADPANRTLTATVTGFSLKTWIADRTADVTGAASWAEYQSGRILGVRARRPDCSGKPPVPAWVRGLDTVEDDNAQVFACGYGSGDDLVVKVVNNRGYPVSLQFDRAYERASASFADDGVLGVFQAVTALRAANRVLVIAGGSADVVFSAPHGPAGVIQGWARHDAGALAQWLTFQTFTAAGGDLPLPNGKTLGLDNVDCLTRLGDGFWAGTQRDAAGALDGTRGCLQSSLEAQVRAWGVEPSSVLFKDLNTVSLPEPQKRAVKVLRLLRGLTIAEWAQQAGDLVVNDRGPAADLVDVSIAWRGASSVRTVPLYTLTGTTSSVGESGQRLDATLAGRRFRRSTGAWVGCEGEPATIVDQLGGRYTRLTAVAGLQPHTPADLTVRMDITGDGRVLKSLRLTAADTVSVDVDVSGIHELRLSALKIGGECTVSSVPYGAWGDALLTKR